MIINIDSGWASLIVLILSAILGWLLRAEVRFSKIDSQILAIEAKAIESDRRIAESSHQIAKALDSLYAHTTQQEVLRRDIEYIKGALEDQKRLTFEVIMSIRELRSEQLKADSYALEMADNES